MKKVITVLLSITMVMLMVSCAATPAAAPAAAPEAAPQEAAAGAQQDEGQAVKVDYPTKAITIIVPFSAGGGMDLTTRLLVDSLSAELPQALVVENKPGASGEVGWTECFNADPDGYTIAIASTTLVINPLAGPVSYDFEDFEYLMATCHDPRVAVVSAQSDIYTLEDLLEYSKENRVVIGDSGATEINHYSGLDLADHMGLENFDFVHFDGASNNLLSVAAGDVTVGITGASESKVMATSGQVRAICVMWDERIPDYPDVATAQEQGYEGLKHTAIRGFVSTPGTPKEICDILSDAMYHAVETDKYKEGEANVGVTRNIVSGEEFKQLLVDDYANYVRLVELEKSLGK